MNALIAWYTWLYFALFLAAVAIAGVWAAFMDRRRGRAIEHDPQRPGPRRPEDISRHLRDDPSRR